MPMIKHSLILMALLIALICSVPSYGQAKNEKIFTTIPLAQRARFIQRLNLYIEYWLKGQQDKLLELYDEETVCSLCKGKPKCIEDCRPPMIPQLPEGYNSVLIEFHPTEVKPYKYDAIWNYYIEVEQKERVSWRGKAPHLVKSKVRMFAVYQNNDWYFSLVSVGPLIDL